MRKYLYMLVVLLGVYVLNAQDIKRIVWPQAPDEARIEFISSIRKSDDLGIKKGFFAKAFDFMFGDEDAVLLAPFGVYADKTRLYVTDISLKEVYVFDKDENEMMVISGSDDETFLYPIDVVTDSKGNIYVSDSVRAKIYVFEDNGDFSHTIAPRELQRCVGIAISPDDTKLYIVDALSSKIFITALNGKEIGSIGGIGSGEGEFNKPTYIDVSKEGKIYVSDSMNHRVQIFNKDGKYVDSFGHLGQTIGNFGSPRGISLDSDNNIYVTDTMFNAIQIFNSKGELLLVLGGYGGRDGEFALPEDISVVSDGSIYIADTNNQRIQLLKKLELSKSKEF